MSLYFFLSDHIISHSKPSYIVAWILDARKNLHQTPLLSSIDHFPRYDCSQCSQRMFLQSAAGVRSKGRDRLRGLGWTSRWNSRTKPTIMQVSRSPHNMPHFVFAAALAGSRKARKIRRKAFHDLASIIHEEWFNISVSAKHLGNGKYCGRIVRYHKAK